MAIRVARGYDAVHHPYQELYEGVRPSIQGLTPATFLPVALLDKIHDDDPIVLLPGTFVGVLNSGQSSGDTTQAGTFKHIVPACPYDYIMKYTQNDVDFGTPDVDNALANVSAAGNTTALIGSSVAEHGIRPIGVVTAPVYSGALASKYTNYTRDLSPSILTGPYTVVIPAITSNERTILPGDVVCLDNSVTNPMWDPANLGTGTWSTVGRIRSLPTIGLGAAGDAATGIAQLNHHIVGRCINKWVVARGTAVTKLGTDLTNSTTLTSIDTRHQYATLKRVQTVPGLGLSGSGTQGIPAMFKHARSDGNGDFFALEIRVDL